MLVGGGLVLSQEGGDFKKPKKGKGGDAGFQDPGGAFRKQKKDKGDEENPKMAKLLEKSYKKAETERDKVIKELVKLNPEQELADDFSQWYVRVAGAGPTWRREDISRKQIVEIFDRMIQRLELPGDSITRAQFLRYAGAYWRPDNSPPWKEAKDIDFNQEAEKLFKHLDRDRNGVLGEDEITGALRAELPRWDKNSDGVISFDEYRAYFPHRLEGVQRELTQPMAPGPIVEIPSLDEKPIVIRAGNLPKGLPAWFTQLDTDKDGQVALYEWHRAGWPHDEYKKVDLNDDGFLEPTEVLRVLAITRRGGERPFAYLMDKKCSAELGTKLAKSKQGAR